MPPKKGSKVTPKTKVEETKVSVPDNLPTRSTRNKKDIKTDIKIDIVVAKIAEVKKPPKGKKADVKQVSAVIDAPTVVAIGNKRKGKSQADIIVSVVDLKKVKKIDAPTKVLPNDDKKDVVDDKDDTKLSTKIFKGGAAVDDQVYEKEKYHVLNDNSKIYDCTMNQTNIMGSNNNNKFYIVQVLVTDSAPKLYFTFNRWGRVGNIGQFGMKGPWDKLECIRDYLSKVRDKSSKGEYRILETDFTPAVDPSILQKKQDEAFGKSKLHLKVKELIHLIYDLKMINKQMLEIGYDSKKMPLGKLAKSTIEKGFQVLEQISQAIKNKSGKGELERLSSEFYSQIPHNFGMKPPAIIITAQDVKTKLEMLESIQQIQVATKILEADTNASENENILDTHYDKLECKVGWITPGSKKYVMLESYVKNTHASTHSHYSLEVQEIYELEKGLDKTRFKKDIGNRRLLWHGSRLTNFVGILSQGLRIAPPEAPSTGYMFGKGVYFADMVSKSANYCGASRENDIGMLLLCDVALGEMNDKYHADYNAQQLPAGKHSTRGVGKTAPPESSYVDDEGCKVPLGKGEPTNQQQNGPLLYNEYIVYDVAQVQFKYLIKLKYNYK